MLVRNAPSTTRGKKGIGMKPSKAQSRFLISMLAVFIIVSSWVIVAAAKLPPVH